MTDIMTEKYQNIQYIESIKKVNEVNTLLQMGHFVLIDKQGELISL